LSLKECLKMKKKQPKDRYRQKKNREDAMAAGFYDGRFREKVVKDKKKWSSKRGSRTWRLPDNEE
jgi:hypothetical protein